MGNLELQSGIPWLRIKSEGRCPLCSIEKEDMVPYALCCPYFFNDWKSFWYRQRQVVLASSDGDAQTFLFLFVKNLDNDSRIRLLAGCLKNLSTSIYVKKWKNLLLSQSGKFIESLGLE